MFDQSQTLQLIVKQRGKDDSRFGSVSFSMKKLAAGMGNSFIHWVTLFQNLKEDTFEGVLGENEGDCPRLLVEYSVIGGQYTSLVNDMNRVKG
jgi:hypothetical protein